MSRTQSFPSIPIRRSAANVNASSLFHEETGLRILLAFSALAWACPVAAQVTVRAVAESELKVGATLNEFGGRFWYDYKRVPIGQDLGTRMTLRARVSPSAFSGEAVAQTSVIIPFGTLAVSVTDTARTSFSGAGLPTRSYNASCGWHQVAIMFSAAVPTAGYLEVVAAGSRPGTVKIDNRILNSGTPVVLTSRPLKIVVSSNVRSIRSFSGQHSDYSYITVTFRPSAGVLRTIGTPCGPELGAAYERTSSLKPQYLTLRVSGSKSPLYGVIVVGLQSLSLALPPLGCVLRTNPLVTVLVVASSTGEATLATAVPATTAPGLFYLQYAAVIPHAGGTAWTMSNALGLRVQ